MPGLSHVVLTLLASLLCVSAQQSLRVYVYDLPRHLSEDVVTGGYQQPWLQGAYEYEADLWVYKQMVYGSWRVRDPAEANLFYIPILPTRFLHQSLSDEINWHQAIDLTAEYISEALQIVQNQPYWWENNGRDHFLTITADSARCAHLGKLPRSLWGNLRLILHLGDLVLREEGIPCYDPDSDILLPAFNPLDKEPLTDVWGYKRNVTALYRFGITGPTAEYPYHTRLIRPELYEEFQASPLPGSDWSIRNKQDSLMDMTHSLFCVCPPGIVAHTSRLWRAFRRGCVPVTFFRAYDLPFSDVIDYSKVTVNIQPDNLHNMHITLAAIIHDKNRLQQLQMGVHRVQHMLLWEGDTGILQLLEGELLKRFSSKSILF